MATRTQKMRKRLVTVVATLVVSGILLFAAAGSLAYPRGWAYLLLTAGLYVVNFVVLIRVNPDVIAERAEMGAGTKPYERVVGVFVLLAMVLLPVLAGLSAVRFGSPAFGAAGIVAGVVLTIAADALILWTMAENRHLGLTVRDRDDGAQKVVTTGPYRFVRHPMYAGAVLQYLGAPLLLGSAWAFAATLVMAVTLIVRTLFEERALRADLDGYAAYMETTRFRLVPGLW